MWFAALSPSYAGSWFGALVERLLENDRATLKLLRSSPFPPDAPPRFVRARLFRYRYTTWRELRETGAVLGADVRAEYPAADTAGGHGPALSDGWTGPARRASRARPARAARFRRRVISWNGRSRTAIRSPSASTADSSPASGRSSRSVTPTPATGKPAVKRGPRPAAVGLVEADHHVAAAVVGQLDGGDHDRVPVGRDQRRDLAGARAPPLGQVDPPALAHGVADARPRHQRVPEPVHALVGLRVGEAGARSRETRTVVVVPASPSVRTVRVTSWPASSRRRRPHPRRAPPGGQAVVAGLELGRLPAGVGVRGPVEVPELGLRRVALGVHVEREGELEELLRLCASRPRASTSSRRPRRQRVSTWVTREEPKERTIRHRGAVVAGDDLVGAGEVGDRVAVELVDVPGVLHVREVGVELEQVAGPARRDRLAVRGDVVRRHDQPRSSISTRSRPFSRTCPPSGARGEGGAAPPRLGWWRRPPGRRTGRAGRS